MTNEVFEQKRGFDVDFLLHRVLVGVCGQFDGYFNSNAGQKERPTV